MENIPQLPLLEHQVGLDEFPRLIILGAMAESRGASMKYLVDCLMEQGYDLDSAAVFVADSQKYGVRLDAKTGTASFYRNWMFN